MRKTAIIMAVALAAASVCFACGDEAEFVYDKDWVEILTFLPTHDHNNPLIRLTPRTRGDFITAVKRGINADIKTLRDAYQARLRDKPGLHGKINIVLSIDESGKVISTQVETTMNDKMVENTVEEMVKRWNFGKVDKPDDVTKGYIWLEFGPRIILDICTLCRAPHEIVVNFTVDGAPGKARPDGSNGVIIRWDFSEEYLEPEDLANQTTANHTPHVLTFDESQRGKTIKICAAWRNEHGIIGPWGRVFNVKVP